MKKKYESGRSMVEMVGVLAVMGLITAGAFVLMRSGMATQKRNRAQDEIANIVSTIRTLSAGADDFSNLIDYADDDEKGANLLTSLHLPRITPFCGDGMKRFYTVRWYKKYPQQFFVKIVNIDSGDCRALKATAWPDAIEKSVMCNVAGTDGPEVKDCGKEEICDFMVSYGK